MGDQKITLSSFLEKREKVKHLEKKPRESCLVCGLAKSVCYCHKIFPFDPQITFVILTHKIEVERKIATGKMSHLMLQNSHYFIGHDFSHHEEINNLINDKNNFCCVFFPSEKAKCIDDFSPTLMQENFGNPQKLIVFIVDGTWATSRQTLRLSSNLSSLPHFFFTRKIPSQFRIRKQPKEGCLSSLEAIHYLIETLGPYRKFDISQKKHDSLLEIFDFMIETQLSFY